MNLSRNRQMSGMIKIGENQSVSLIIKGTQTVYEKKYYSIMDIIIPLYNYLFDSVKFRSWNEQNFNFPEIKIIIYYFNLPVTIFNVSLDNGVLLYNDDNKIKLSSISPQHAALDILITKMYEKGYLWSDVKISEKLDPQNGSNFNANLTLRSDAKFPEPVTMEIHDPKTKEKLSMSEQLDHSSFMRCEQKVEDIGNELKVFESDKRSYVLIKRDVEEGKIIEDEINPFFVPKYQIFKVLESRGAINFSDNCKLEEEYRLFRTLYDVCKEDESNSREWRMVPYVPHNFQYLSEQEKKSYVEKFQMTLEEFEKRCDETREKSLNKDFGRNKIDDK